MKRPDAILVADRFAPLRKQLITLLASLGETDWDRPTAAPRWSVKDVTAHLLGGDFSILSGKRDGFHGTYVKVDDYAQLVELINRLNSEWVLAMRRMSPRLITNLLAFTGPEVESCFASLDPMMMGGPVSWAGPESAPVWFDIAREFTERWHHQQQIRDATGRAPLYDPYFLSPVLDTFVRALPHNFRNTMAPAGTTVRFEISGDAGGVWFLYREEQNWILALESSTEPAADVVLPQDTAWRLFTKGIDRQDARARAVIRGDAGLASPIFATTAIIG
ncbi:MAG: maleylpyruvate isomerase family mycothiol-dependent enzyme [Bryobacteraceae bacterium]